MTIGRFHRWVLRVTLCLAIAGCVAGSPLLLGAGAVLGAVIFLLPPGQIDLGQKPTVLTQVSVHALTVLGLAAAVVLFRTARIDSVVLVVFLGVFNRYVLRQGHRDDLILVGAATVLIAVATTITPGIGFLPLILAYVSSALFCLWTSLLRSLDPPRMVREPLPEGRRVIVGVGLSLTLALTLALSLFPRHQFLRVFGAGYFARLPGASPRMQLSDSGAESEGDRAVVLRVHRTDPGIAKFKLRDLYARMFVLESFDGKTWQSDLENQRVPRLAPPLAAASGAALLRLTLERRIEHRTKHPLVALGRDKPWDTPLPRLRYTPGGSWVLGGRFRGQRLTYAVDMDAPMTRLATTEHFGGATDFLALPEDVDPRIVTLAKSLGEGRARPEVVSQILQFFRRGFSYSTEPLPGTESEPLARFLFEAKAGHCELYAGAVALLLRLNGVPARVATGYYGGWWNDLGNYLEFTEEDAHSWVEVQNVSGEWTWIDATPPQLRARQGKKRWSWLRDAYDAIQALWYDNVIDFDEQKRRALLGDLKWKVVPDSWKLEPDNQQKNKPLREQLNWSQPIAWLICLAAAVAVFAWMRARRARDELPGLGVRIREVLDSNESELPVGQLVSSAPPQLRVRADKVVARYQALRFSDRKATPEALGRLAAEVQALEASAAEVTRDTDSG